MIEVGVSVPVMADHGDDYDVFAVRLEAGYRYHVRGYVTDRQFFHSDGRLLPSVPRIDDTGVYFIRVRPFDVPDSSFVVEPFVDDYTDNTDDQTFTLSSMSAVSGILDSPTDIDVFSFQGTPDNAYMYSISGFDSTDGISIKDRHGATVTWIGLKEWVMPKEGVVFFRLTLGNLGHSAEYHLTVKPIADEPELPSLRNLLPTSGAWTVITNGPGDLDIAQIDLTDGVSLSLTPPSQSQILVTDATGAQTLVEGEEKTNIYLPPGRTLLRYSNTMVGERTVLYRIDVDDFGNFIQPDALEITNGSTVAVRMDYEGDTDVFRLLADQGDMVNIGPYDDVIMTDELGQMVPRSTDFNWIIDRQGAYYLHVQGANGSTYRLQTRIVLEPPSLPTSSRVPELRGTQHSVISSPSDVDVWRFLAHAGDEIDIQTGGIRPSVQVLRPDGSTTSETAWTVPTTGTYYAILSRGTTVGSYGIKLLVNGLQGDDHADTISSSPPLRLIEDIPASGVLDNELDVDVFRFHLPRTSRISLSITGVDRELLQIVDSDGRAVDQRSPLDVGTYYVILKPHSKSDLRDYTLDLRVDANENFASIDYLAVPLYLGRTVGVGLGVDELTGWPIRGSYSFYAIAGESYRIFNFNSADRVFLGQNPGQLQPIVANNRIWTAEATGTIYIGVESSNSSSHTMLLRVASDQGADLMGPQAQRILPGFPVFSNAFADEDVDVYSFEAIAGREYYVYGSGTFRGPDGRSFSEYLRPTSSGVYFVMAPRGGAGVNTSFFLLELGFNYIESQDLDFTNDGFVDGNDVEVMLEAHRQQTYEARFDLRLDERFNQQDIDTFFAEAPFSRTDFNLNGTVDFADFLVLAESFGKSAQWHDGDVDGDGFATFIDFLALAQSFGEQSKALTEPSRRLTLS